MTHSNIYTKTFFLGTPYAGTIATDTDLIYTQTWRNSWSFMYRRWTAVHIHLHSWSILRSARYSTIRVHIFVFILSQTKFKFRISGRLSRLSRIVIPNVYTREKYLSLDNFLLYWKWRVGIFSSPVVLHFPHLTSSSKFLPTPQPKSRSLLNNQSILLLYQQPMSSLIQLG